MTSSARYVFDTNVIVSALLVEHSTSGRAFYASLDRGEILLSQPVVEELNDVTPSQFLDSLSEDLGGA